jgi:tRNA1(Val) A37 N6-methylase TrmN6
MMATHDIDIDIESDEIRLLDGRVTCFQPVRGYRSAIDPVLMQAAVPALAGDKVLELGCGAGQAALCLAHRCPGVSVTGLDIQAPLIALAVRGAAANGCADRVGFIAGDILTPPPVVATAVFDHVMANPPYQKAGTSRPSPDPIKATATVEGAAVLADWVRCAGERVRVGGTATVIHHGARGEELAALMSEHFGDLSILPVFAQAGDAEMARTPLRVIVHGTKEAGPTRRTLPPLILHETGARYGLQADQVLRGYADFLMKAG